MARYRSFAEHLAPDVGPKRILALDGGGLRGVLTLGMLREIETLLRARHGDDPDFRLCDYFDLIAGTSTGAIIAAALSLGMSVDEVHGHYMRLGQLVFKRSLLRWGALRAKFDGDKVRECTGRRVRRPSARQPGFPHRVAGGHQAAGHRQRMADHQQPRLEVLQERHAGHDHSERRVPAVAGGARQHRGTVLLRPRDDRHRPRRRGPEGAEGRLRRRRRQPIEQSRRCRR